MTDIQAIDTMNRVMSAKPQFAKKLFETREYEVMADNTFGGVKARNNISDDENWKIYRVLGAASVEEMVAQMDETGVELTFMDQLIQWSRYHKEAITVASIEELAEMRDESDGRIIPGVGYNPFKIRESLNNIERAVDDLDFKYIWFHPMTFEMRPTHRNCYPLYSKAVELGVPVCYQTGQSAEQLTSEPGKPMYADEVAMDFPDLKLVLTHGGWPWHREWISMLWRHPNVYGNIGAYYPSFFPDEMWDFIDSGRLRDSVMWATNGLGFERCKQEFLDLPIGDDTKQQVLRDNALNVFDI